MLEHQLRDANELRALSDAMITTLWERASEQRIRALGNLRPLASLVDVQGGGTPSKSNPAYWIGDIPWVSPKDMKRWEITDAEDHISLEATTESPAKLVQPGAVLIVTRGMILARNVPVARLAVKAAINQDMKALHARDSIDAEYVLIALRALNRDLLALVAKSSHDTRKLETSKLLAYEVPLPSLTDQQAIVRDLKLLRDRVEEALGQAQASRDDLRVLPRRILSEAFRPAQALN
jgi:type I restriction enzyme S subunit